MNEPVAVTIPVEAPPSLESVVRRWWASLEEDRGGRAALRRCATPTDVAFEPAFHRLLARMEAAGQRVSPERLAVVAAVLAHAKTDRNEERSFAALLAAPQGERARLSGLRFRRLLQTEPGAELLVAMVRAMRLVDGAAPVASLAKDLLFWSDTVRKRWATDYYRLAPSKEP